MKYAFYSKENQYLFANAGISNGHTIGNITNEYFQQRQLIGTDLITETDGKVVEEIRKYEQGFIAGIGYSFGEFAAESRIEFGTGMSRFINLSSSTTRISLLISYQFQ